ncbi:hypothetical protein KQX54_012054 [Cotesia glomerata]|uniref:Uncharacterized protein n=1 Tax=Cotesia glomerata TaxID=32391 RepID=A0AAV7J452_COTGL|nr:hypothetical protein KQX54_012054 [Cotesia glomerata]
MGEDSVFPSPSGATPQTTTSATIGVDSTMSTSSSSSTSKTVNKPDWSNFNMDEKMNLLLDMSYRNILSIQQETTKVVFLFKKIMNQNNYEVCSFGLPMIQFSTGYDVVHETEMEKRES